MCERNANNGCIITREAIEDLHQRIENLPCTANDLDPRIHIAWSDVKDTINTWYRKNLFKAAIEGIPGIPLLGAGASMDCIERNQVLDAIDYWFEE